MGQLLTSGSAGPLSLAFPPSLNLRRDHGRLPGAVCYGIRDRSLDLQGIVNALGSHVKARHRNGQRLAGAIG